MDHDSLAESTVTDQSGAARPYTEQLNEQESEAENALDSLCTISDTKISQENNESVQEFADIDTQFDISKLDIETIYLSRNEKFHKVLAHTKCYKCWNRYGFYDIDYNNGPWALYCSSPEHKWSEYVCSNCYLKSAHFTKKM